MKILAQMSTLSSRQIVHESTDDVSNATAAILPSTTQLRQTVNRARKIADAPKNPTKLSEIRFSQRYSQTASGKNFILYDTHDDEDLGSRLIIFGTQENLDFILRCDGLFMDGTFGIVPRLFYQLYTIHGNISIHICRLIYTTYFHIYICTFKIVFFLF